MPGTLKKLLVIGHVWPEPLATAAGRRMLQLLDGFGTMGFEITFVTAAVKSEYSHDLKGLGIKEVAIKLNDPGFDRFIQQLVPDIVMFDRFMTEEQFGWRIAENLSSCLRILNTEDLHSLRAVREQNLKENKEFTHIAWLQADITKRELASIYRSDLSLIISRFEKDLLLEYAAIPEDLLLYLPLLYDKDEDQSERKLLDFNQRRDFIFIGNGKHRPNIDAITWLSDELWPLLRAKLPETNLHIYGAYLPEKIQNLNHPDSGFFVHGWTANSEAVLSKARVNLVPLRYGAGLKGKLLEAMTCGTPGVVTQVGLEGLDYEEKVEIRAADDSTSFVQSAVELYLSRSKWEERQKKDQQLLSNEFEKAPYLKELECQLRYLLEDLEEHRLKNPVGGILMHHSMASTKYLSKWIETKNRNPEI